MIETTDILSIIGACGGLIGATAGLISIWLQINQRKLRLQVVPIKIYFLDKDNAFIASRFIEEIEHKFNKYPHTWGVRVINQSGYSVFIDEVGYGYHLKLGRSLFLKPETIPKKETPVNLQAGESVDFFVKDTLRLQKNIPKEPKAYAVTGNGKIIKGTSHFFKKLVKETLSQ